MVVGAESERKRLSQLLEKRAKERTARLAFMAEDARLPIPTTKPFQTKNDKKESRGKPLNYEKESKDVREHESMTCACDQQAACVCMMRLMLQV